MKNLWKVFDMKDTGKIPMKDFQKIMKALDFNLNPEELAILQKQIDPENTGFITKDNLKIVMEEKLKEVDTYEDMCE